MKKISVIVPCYNSEKFLSTCVESLLGQTMGMNDMELIFIDDASTDSSFELLKNYEKKNSDSILIIHLDENGRQGNARNIGMAYASGEYVGFVDSDDFIELDMYEKLYDLAEKYNLDMAGGRIVRKEEGKSFLLPNHMKTGGVQEIIDKRGRMDLILNGNNGGICTKIFRRSMLVENELYFPPGKYYEDNYFLPMTCLYINKYYILDQIVYHYIDHGESTVNKKEYKAMEDRLEIEQMKLQEYARRGFLKDYFIGIEALFCRSYYIDTLLSFWKVFGEVPESFYKKMKQDVKELFPDCLSNFMLIEKDKELLASAFSELTNEQLVQMLKQYLDRQAQ